MKQLLTYSGLALAAAALAACTGGDASRVDMVRASFSISAVGGSVPSAIVQDSGEDRDDSLDFGGRVIRRSHIDSLIVIVTKVKVLPDEDVMNCHPPVGDSIMGFHPGEDDCDDHGENPMGPHMGPGGEDDSLDHDRPDSLLPPDTGWGSRERNWFTLDVVSGGHIDLLHLPTDTTKGIVLASASLPVGMYHAARLIVTSATIYFDTTFTTAGGFTFKADTGYTVTLPMRDSVMGIMTKAGFDLTVASPTVVLVFDPRTMLNGAIVSASGQIIIRPVLHPGGEH